jgi:hypothetical protein
MGLHHGGDQAIVDQKPDLLAEGCGNGQLGVGSKVMRTRACSVKGNGSLGLRTPFS